MVEVKVLLPCAPADRGNNRKEVRMRYRTKPTSRAKLHGEGWDADYCDEQACILLPILELIQRC